MLQLLTDYYMGFSQTAAYTCRQASLKSGVKHKRGLVIRAGNWERMGLLKVAGDLWDPVCRYKVRTYRRTASREQFVRAILELEESRKAATKEYQAAQKRALRAAEKDDDIPDLPEVRKVFAADRRHLEEWAHACRRIGSLGAMCGAS